MSTPHDTIAAFIEAARHQHRQHVSPSFPAPGVCVSRCPGTWPCVPARAFAALEAIPGGLCDGDGKYIDRDCYVPLARFHDALVDALTGPASWRPDPVPAGPAPDYLTEFTEFWAPIVQRPDGTLSFGQIARELSDYSKLMGWASEVYSGVTDGAVSKTNTLPAAVIAQAQEATDRAVGYAIDDLISYVEAHGRGASSAAEVADLIRELTGRPAPRRTAAEPA